MGQYIDKVAEIIAKVIKQKVEMQKPIYTEREKEIITKCEKERIAKAEAKRARKALRLKK